MATHRICIPPGQQLSITITHGAGDGGVVVLVTENPHIPEAFFRPIKDLRSPSNDDKTSRALTGAISALTRGEPYRWLGEVVLSPEAKLLNLKNMGKRRFAVLREAVALLGLSLGMTVDQRALELELQKRGLQMHPGGGGFWRQINEGTP